MYCTGTLRFGVGTEVKQRADCTFQFKNIFADMCIARARFRNDFTAHKISLAKCFSSHTYIHLHVCYTYNRPRYGDIALVPICW